MNANAYRAKINAAIRHLGVKIMAGRGYSYFHDLKTGDQVGDSVMVFRQSDQSVERWVQDAEAAIAQQKKQDSYRSQPSPGGAIRLRVPSAT